MDESYVRIAGRWMHLFRAVDDRGQPVDFYLSETRDRDAAKRFLEAALANPDNRPPHVLTMDGNRSYPAAILELKIAGAIRLACRHRCRQYGNNPIESNHRMSNGDCVPCRGRGQGRRHGRLSRNRSSADDQKGPGARDRPE
jgi:transposase-like protein